MAPSRLDRSLTSDPIAQGNAMRLAVWALRSIAKDHHVGGGWFSLQPGAPVHLLGRAVVSLRHANDLIALHHGSGMRIAAPDCPQLSRDEWRLVRAASAAQTHDDALIDNLLFKLAPGRRVRQVLAEAVHELAAILAAAGHWLPPPVPARQLPAPALSVARLHGAPMHAIDVAWP